MRGLVRREIADRLEESAQIKQDMAKGQIGEIECVVKSIITAYKTGVR